MWIVQQLDSDPEAVFNSWEKAVAWIDRMNEEYNRVFRSSPGPSNVNHWTYDDIHGPYMVNPTKLPEWIREAATSAD